MFHVTNLKVAIIPLAIILSNYKNSILSSNFTAFCIELMCHCFTNLNVILCDKHLS
jgi:hypothetical protein